MKKGIKKDRNIKFYTKILYQYCKTKWYFVFLFMLLSCTIQKEIIKEDYKPIPEHLSVHFYDKLDSIVSLYDGSIRTRSLIKDFSNSDNINFLKPIQLQIVNNKLFMKFFDKNGKEYVMQFYGKRYKKKFVFYTNYKTISFPLLFISKEMTKYSVYLSDHNEIVFENINVNEGTFIIFGGGGSSQFDYKFKILKDE